MIPSFPQQIQYPVVDFWPEGEPTNLTLKSNIETKNVNIDLTDWVHFGLRSME